MNNRAIFSKHVQLMRYASASLLALAAGAPALAQEQVSADAAVPVGNAAEDMGNEIVVTAQFRQQNLQDTPTAITAINARSIEERNLGSVVDIAQTAPNVNIRPGGSAFGPAAQVYIRGIG